MTEAQSTGGEIIGPYWGVRHTDHINEGPRPGTSLFDDPEALTRWSLVRTTLEAQSQEPPEVMAGIAAGANGLLARADEQV